MNTKIERWRNQTLVNRTRSDSMIAAEYYTLIKFIVDEYKLRMEMIQNPLLHLFSHCAELMYKEVVLYAMNHNYIEGNIEKTRKGHDLEKLSNIFIDVCKKISQENVCNDDDKVHITEIAMPAHKMLCKKLATTTTTYRYYAKYDKDGNMKGKSIPFDIDEESPNIAELFPLFDDCYYSASYILEILYFMFSMEE